MVRLVYTGDRKLRLIRESKRRLPKNFREVEYLESSGTQYIDTGLAPNANQKIELRGFKAGGGSTSGGYIGCGSTATANDRIQIWAEGGGLAWFRVDGTSIETNESCTVNRKFVLDIKNKKGYVDSSEYNLSYSGSLTTYPYFLFLRNNGGTPDTTYNAPMRLYYVKIWDNDTLVRDLIPCLDASNIPCMYDLVEGKAYYNAGTGSFTYGHTITPVEYLEADGSQFIKTGVVPNNSTGAYGVFNLNNITAQNYALGSRGSQAGVGRFYLYNNENSTKVRYGWGSLNTTDTDTIVGTKVSVSLNYKNDKKYIYNNSILVQSLADVSWSSNTYQMYLFSTNFAGNDATSMGAGINGKIYKAQITQGTETIRDFIPCKDENNVGYMFDKVTHSLYANDGTGAFVVGNEIKQDITRFVKDDVPNIYRKVSYLESSGTQYIDTGYKPTVDTETEVFFDNYQFSRIEYFFGCYSTDYRTNCYHAGCYQNDIRVFVNGSPELSSYVGNYVASGGTTGIPFPTILQSIKMTKSNVVVNGTTYTYTQNPNTPINVNHNMFLFGASDSGSFRSDRGFNGKIKCCRIKNSNVLVRDFIPVVRKSDNKPGMYDRVTKQFFTNAGTGEFIIPT